MKIFGTLFTFDYLFNLKLISMIKIIKTNSRKFSLLVASLLLSILSFAQDKKINVDINTKSDNSNVFMQPWVWVVGGALFILLLVALLRNKNN